MVITNSNTNSYINIFNMDFMHQDSDTVFLTELFNEEHAALLVQQKLQLKPNFHKIILNNVGVKIMRDAF